MLQEHSDICIYCLPCKCKDEGERSHIKGGLVIPIFTAPMNPPRVEVLYLETYIVVNMKLVQIHERHVYEMLDISTSHINNSVQRKGVVFLV